MHGNHGRSQRRGRGAIEDRQNKVKARAEAHIKAATELTDAAVALQNVNRAAFEKRAK